jgi:hypothetical protein
MPQTIALSNATAHLLEGLPVVQPGVPDLTSEDIDVLLNPLNPLHNPALAATLLLAPVLAR